MVFSTCSPLSHHGFPLLQSLPFDYLGGIVLAKPKYLRVGGKRDQAGKGTRVAVRGSEMPHRRTSLDYFFHSRISMIPVHSLLGILNQGREEGDHGAEMRSLK